MSDAILNPRRVHRASARCRTAVRFTQGEFVTETEDICARGCQIVSPRSLARGWPLAVRISSPRVNEDLTITGRVAWASAQAPWRLGIAFDGSELTRASRFMDALLAAYPAIASARRIPERIAPDATVFLGTPPSLLVDFGPDELRLLRAVGVGRSVGDLRASQGDWPRLQRIFFSLLAAQHLTLSRPASSHPNAWRQVLGDDVALPSPAPRTVTPVPVAATAATPPPVPAPAPPRPRPAGPAASREAMARALDPRTSTGGAHAPDHAGAGVGWRQPAGSRSPEAQECFDRAGVELQAGRALTALALLRRALALAPGDPEVAAAIGAAMFRRS